MIARSAWHASLLALLLGGCSTVAPTPPPFVPTPAPTLTAAPPTLAPTPTPEPTIDPQPLPTTSKFGWWEQAIKYCQPPAYYRLSDQVVGLGACNALLGPTPKVVTLDVGQDIDVHMAVLHDGGAPLYPLPEPEDPLVARGWLIFDEATMTYRALSPGSTRLVAEGSCDSLGAAGSCPVLEIRVADIETECVDLEPDVCRGAAATAILWGWSPHEVGQLVAGWRVEPSSLIGAYCGELFAIVTLSLRSPVETMAISVGRLESPASELTRYAVCTY